VVLLKMGFGFLESGVHASGATEVIIVLVRNGIKMVIVDRLLLIMQ
jgi:hypothetical protein